MANFWDEEITLKEIEKGSKMVKFRIVKKGDKTYFEQREWFEKDGEEHPTKKGFTWPLTKELWPDFELAMEEAMEMAKNYLEGGNDNGEEENE